MSSVSGPREVAAAQRPVSGTFQQDASATKPGVKAATAATATGTGTAITASTAAATAQMEPSSGVHYTCLIRLPFPRADFVDPQQVEWSSAKDRLLWKTISKASNSKELDWEDLSTRFDVSLPFLLQQAAWLYERHFAQMKAQMKKLSPSANPSPIPPDSASNVSTPITGTFASNNLGPRATSALSGRARDSPTPTTGSGIIKPSSSASTLANEAPFATYTSTLPQRTPSTRTVTQSRNSGAPNSPIPPASNNRSFRSSFGSQRKAAAHQAQQPQQEEEEEPMDYESPPPAEPSDSESSSDEDEKESRSMARSQAFRRPLARTRKGTGPHSYADSVDDDDDDLDDEDEDDESSGGFLPFAATASSKNEDVAATLRSPPPPRRTADRLSGKMGIESSASSGGSSGGGGGRGGDGGEVGDGAVPLSSRRKHPNTRVHTNVHTHHHSSSERPQQHQHQHQQQHPASALSPRHQSMLSPRLRREGSEGAPSMGSSFSDLDDASISQSALEDAYLSNMQRGGTASRMSTISQALKSRYL